MYFNYHAKAKSLINEGHLTDFEIVPKWNLISPALVLFFDNHKPMPIRKYRWDGYWEILDRWDEERNEVLQKEVKPCLDC